MSRQLRTTRPPRTTVRALARCLLTLGAVASLTGSALASPPREGGDKLSDAAKETAKPPAEQRTLKGSDQKDCDHGTAIDISIFEPYHRREPSPHENPFDDIHVGAVVAVGSLASPDFAPSALYGVRIGTSDSRRTIVDLALLAGRGRFAAGSDVAALLRDPRELALEASVRYSLTPADAAFGIAPVAGFRVGLLTWRYLNGIYVERAGRAEQVRGDRIEHYSPYLGLAMTCVRSRHLELGATVLTGWRFYGTETNEGLRNDLFGQARFNELRIETRLMF